MKFQRIVMKILLIDNYDSFVYNIVGLLQRCRQEFPDLEWKVVRNDAVSPDDADGFDAIMLSPGPGVPSEAGLLLSLIRQCASTRPMLGVCLGCQAIAEAFGCRLRRLDMPRHGHSSILRDVDPEDSVVGFCSEERGVVGRYHSWVIDETSLRKDIPLIISSRDEDGNVMSIRHRFLPVFGLQFHPESIITDCGLRMIKNFLALSVSSM